MSPSEKLPTWLKNVLYGLLVPVILGIGAFVLNVNNRLATLEERVSKERMDSIDSRLRNVETDMASIKSALATLIGNATLKITNLPQKEFERSLPELPHLLASGRELGTPVAPTRLGQLAEKLLAVKSRTPDFWEASAQLVSYRSFSNVSAEVKKLKDSGTPDCTSTNPTPAKIAKVLNPQQAEITGATYENCRVTLDSETDAQKINKVLQTEYPSVRFKNCIVVYRGGPIKIILEWHGEIVNTQVEGWKESMPTTLSGRTLKFENCLFDFSVQGVPPASGQSATQTLLAQNSDTLRLP